jgi:palmitoyltransferase ZDHHC9/14/18
MASGDNSTSMPPQIGNPSGLIQQGAQRPPSVISSRMTDVASDDGHDLKPVPATINPPDVHPQSMQNTNEAMSRPDTSTMGVSANRSPWAQSPPSRRGQVPGVTGRHISRSGSTSAAGRPQSAASRTHVPSLTSHAFFRPMSSQRLQAQRSGSRAPTPGQAGTSDDGSAEDGNNTARQSLQSNQTPRAGPSISEDQELPPPPSRGTEMTEPETSGRVTSNTSPTYGHHGTGSLSESVRPLQRNNLNTNGLSVNVDKSYKNSGGLPPPSKSPRSFRSSFLLPTRAEAAPNSPNRSAQGREKLSSAASSPALIPTHRAAETLKPRLGRNYEYFNGNTRLWLGGRLQNTRDRPVNIATGLFVLIPSVLFFIFSAPWLWYNISPAIPIIFAYVFYICISSFVHASVSDPGVSGPTGLNRLFLADASRFSPAISIRCHYQTRMRIFFEWHRQLRIGFLSSQHLRRMRLWRCPSNIVKHAIFGDHLEGTTAEFVIIALRITTTTVCGSITALAVEIIDTSSHLLLLGP